VKPLEAALLGLIQGLTEFLPISSTAHLRMIPAMLGWKDAGAAFTAVLQLGTLAAVIGYFLPDLLRMTRAWLQPKPWQNPEAQTLVHLVVGTIPIGVAGLLFKHSIEGPLRSLWVIATTLVVVGVLMAVVERRVFPTRELIDAGLRDAVLVGMAQMLALVPGVSRSGITLIAAMALGMRRDAAARYCFLLGVPAVGAAGLLELPKVLKSSDVSASVLLLGLGVSAVSGYAAISWLIKFLRTRSVMPFVFYRIAVALLLVFGLLSGWWS
jgi:undecaprenyl-diphosphatase